MEAGDLVRPGCHIRRLLDMVARQQEPGAEVKPSAIKHDSENAPAQAERSVDRGNAQAGGRPEI